MRWDLLLIILLLVLLLCSAPGYSQDEDPVAYKPDIVGVGRLILVALKVPAGAAEIKVTVPEEVKMLDRTPLPTKKEQRRYYFRSLKPAKQADIVFAHPAGEITVSIEIWSFEDLRQFRKLKDTQLPRRWPLGEMLPELKEGQTTTTDRMKEVAKGKGASEQWLNFTDDEIWSIQPDTTIPRWHWVNLANGCPVHGKEIYRGGAFYPWRDENDKPIRSYSYASVPYAWKIKCPVGNELYPSNDFANDDFTSGEFPDDGIGGGYIAPDGKHYGFIAETCQAYCHKMLNVAPPCADGYLRTGDIRYVHKALVALSRLAVEYSYLATMTHHRHRNRVTQVERLGQGTFAEGPFVAGGGYGVYCIDQPPYQMKHAEAYDKIWPAIDQDEEIIPYLQSKGFANIKTHEDVRRFLEENLFAVWMQGAMDGTTSSNEPFPQMGLVRMAEVLNYKRGNEFMDWLYDDPRGKMRYFVTNTFFRDGAPYESTGGYNGMHVTAICPVAEGIERLRELRPETYPKEKYPSLTESRRYHSVFDFSMNTVNIDRTYPRVGDGGAWPRFSKRSVRRWQNGGVAAFEHAYKIFKDPKFAWALANTAGWRPSLEFPYTREEIEAEAAKWPDDWNDPSCLQDGYGLAMLRSGEGINKRSLWMMYGRARGHTHEDMLHMGLDAYQSEILGHMGYPRNWNYWYRHWMTQIQARQIPIVNMTATAQLFADAGPVHIAEALAQGFSDKVSSGEGYQISEDNWQRRMLAIVDVSDDQFYCLDLYRMSGGDEHWWTFHAQEGEFATEGLQLTKQDGGTLAGPDVPYGDATWLKEQGRTKWGFAHLYNVERATPDATWSADWELKNADGLHFRMTVPQAEGAEVIVTDATCPAGGDPYEMKFVLMNKQGEAPTQSQIINVMELYKDQPLIKSVTPLEVSGDDEAGFKPYGCVIELQNGRTDTVFASTDGTVLRTAEGGFEFAGRFGLYSEENGVPTHVVLVGGTTLTKDGLGITMEDAEYRAEIRTVDRETETITVSPAPPNPEALVGNYIYITNPGRRLAYKVLEAKAVAGGAELRMEFDSRVGTGQVSGTEDQKVATSTPFHLRGYRYYQGARVVNAERTAEYRILGVAGGAVIDTQAHPDVTAEKLEAEFPVGTWFDVYDYGVGDEVVWPLAVSVTQVSSTTYKVTAPGNVTLSLPKSAKTRVASH